MTITKNIKPKTEDNQARTRSCMPGGLCDVSAAVMILDVVVSWAVISRVSEYDTRIA